MEKVDMPGMPRSKVNGFPSISESLFREYHAKGCSVAEWLLGSAVQVSERPYDYRKQDFQAIPPGLEKYVSDRLYDRLGYDQLNYMKLMKLVKNVARVQSINEHYASVLYWARDLLRQNNMAEKASGIDPWIADFERPHPIMAFMKNAMHCVKLDGVSRQRA